MATHSKGKGIKHLSPEDKASIIAYRDTGMATSESAALQKHLKMPSRVAALKPLLEKKEIGVLQQIQKLD